MSHIELGPFLRTRREAVTPAEVGLPPGGRRRTPGLRRSELATLAGISVEYLTRLEQGRDRHPSPQVIGALADALRLSRDERLLLHHAVKAAGGHSGALCGVAAPPARAVRPTVRTLLDRMEPTPAVVMNRLTDLVAFTAGYEQLARPLGLLDTEPANLARFVLADPRARAAYLEWDHVADELVAELQLAAGDDHAAALMEELTVTAGAAFSGRYGSPPTLPASTGVQRISHPEAGELRLAYEMLDLSGGDGLRLVAYLPADDATSSALDEMVGRRPRALRAVSG